MFKYLLFSLALLNQKAWLIHGRCIVFSLASRQNIFTSKVVGIVTPSKITLTIKKQLSIIILAVLDNFIIKVVYDSVYFNMLAIVDSKKQQRLLFIDFGPGHKRRISKSEYYWYKSMVQPNSSLDVRTR